MSASYSVKHSESAISAKHLNFRYKGREVLKDAHVNLGFGEILGIIGPNGAGKSSLIKLLAGVEPLQSGEIFYQSQPISALTLNALAQQRAYVPQKQDIQWPISVHHAVSLGRLPHTGAWQNLAVNDVRHIERAMQIMELQGIATRSINELSVGEQARVAMARAMATNAKILLCDEPVAALDVTHQQALMIALRSQADQGVAIAVVLHDLNLARRYCDRVALLEQGVIVACGSSSEVLVPNLLNNIYKVEFDEILAKQGYLQPR